MIRNIATLLTGNALSQLVNVGTILFVVTAFFAPAEFGHYAVVMSYVGILSSVACLRYELAIVSLGRQYAANNIVFSTAIIASIFSVLIFVVFKLLEALVGDAFLLGSSPAMIATLIFLRAVDLILASILFRQEAYAKYSILKLLQAIILLGSFSVAGIAELGLNGLLCSTALAYASFALMGLVVVQRYDLRSGVRPFRMVLLLRKNADFVRFSTPQTLLDNLLSNGLNFVLVMLAGPSVVGYFSYMQKILKAPLGLIFGAVSQVVYRFSAKNLKNPDLMIGKLRQVFAIVAAILLIAATGVGIAHAFFDDLIFFQDWSGLREYMIAFSVWMLVPFLFSPFATLPVVYDKQKRFFQLAATFNILSLAALTFLIWKGSITTAFWTVGLFSVVYYIGLNFWLFGIASNGKKS